MRYWREIRQASHTYSLDPYLVAAIAARASDGNTDFFKFEKRAWSRFLHVRFPGENPRRIASFYGLMGVWYPSAFEDGFQGAPELLFIPEVGLDAGCKRLAGLLQWSKGFDCTPDVARMAALAAYRGGRGGNSPLDDPPRDIWWARQVADIRARLEAHDEESRGSSVAGGVL